MCKKNIYHLVKEVEKHNYNIVDSIVEVDEYIEMVTEEASCGEETIAFETESIEIPTETIESETILETIENPAETTAGFEETAPESNTTVNIN